MDEDNRIVSINIICNIMILVFLFLLIINSPTVGITVGSTIIIYLLIKLSFNTTERRYEYYG